MATTAGRKKSIISSSGLQIDSPVANNTLLNQAATSSLYQECSKLRSRLMCIHGFQQYFTLCNSGPRQSTDPVTNLWDLFSNGIPLCYIFDQLPDAFNKINNSEFKQEMFDTNPDRAKKHAIALFAMQIRSDKVQEYIPGCELFTVTDLWDRTSNDGLVKVIKTVSAIVDYLPPDRFEEVDESLVDSGVSTGGARNNVVRELVDTERKYVQDLEIMQKYATALSQGTHFKQDTIHLLFPGLNKLLNFQRKFLIKFEGTAELPWEEQRWGQHFLECEEEFIVYEPYCGNYTNASELMQLYEENLNHYNHLLNVKGELPAFLIKPIQRICKYPLLLAELIKASSPDTYPHFAELEAGVLAAKRITDKINEAQRQAENEQTVKNLQTRVDDWKGHHLENFGRLLLDDIYTVTKSDIDREYHVFLFEKIILCCKEALPATMNGKKVSKNGSILKKQPMSIPGLNQPAKKNTPLLLKGRIFLGNVTQAVPSSPRNSVASTITHYPLAVWWRGDDDLEFFTLRCRSENQMRQWETTINRLIKEAAQRRVADRTPSRLLANSTNPALGRLAGSGYRTPPYSSQPFDVRSRGESIYNERSQFSAAPLTGGPQGYPPPDGFEEGDEDDYEDYPSTNGYTTTQAQSGRGTPIGGPRRTTSSMPPERDHMGGYDRPRALTESGDGPVMAQWRNNSNGVSPGAYGGGALRPNTSRMNSNVSTASYASEASFGNNPQRPALRSQFSSTKLRSGYESSGDYRSGLPNGVAPKLPTPPIAQTPNPPMGSRSRSASQPSAYVPRALPPPLPVAPSHWNSQSNSSVGSSINKRSSGSSQSTGESSDYSPNSSSPITPFGSSESSLGGVGLRPSRSQNFENAVNGVGHAPFRHAVKVKVHFHEDIFVIQVPRATEYNDLVEKVGRKIRLCGPRRDDGPLRVRYRDEDGDMVSLGSTEDVQMAFEQFRPGGQVTLFVT